MPPTAPRSRNWVFTINNPTEALQFPADCRYAIYQKEKGEQGTPHFQGYLCMANSVGLSHMKKIFPTAHWEHRRGSHEQAKAYSSKPETRLEGPWEHGKEPLQGKRKDLDDVKDLIDAGKPELEIAESHFSTWCRNYKALREYKLLKISPRDFKTEVTLVYGPPGLGKSYWCKSESPDAYYKQQSNWWDGYEPGQDVVLDDFYGWIPYSTMLRLMDQYPCQVEFKGGHIPFKPKRMYITSNKEPDHWYGENVPYNHLAFTRRIDRVIRFTGFKEYTVYGNYKDFSLALIND